MAKPIIRRVHTIKTDASAWRTGDMLATELNVRLGPKERIVFIHPDARVAAWIVVTEEN